MANMDTNPLTPSDASLLDPSMELDIDLYEAILAAFRGTLPEGCINFPMTGTVAFAATQAAQRFYAERAVRTMLHNGSPSEGAPTASDWQLRGREQ